QEKLSETEQELKATRERLSFEVETRDNNHIFRMLRNAKANGDVMRFLDYMIQVKRENKAHFDNAFKYIASLFKNESPEYRNMVYSKILSGMKPEDVPEVIMRAGSSDAPLDLG